MLSNYDMSAYREDLALAEAKYTEVIRSFCESNGATLELDSDGIYQAKKVAMGKKSQLISAAGKRLRAGVALRLLDKLQSDVDLTVTLAVRLTEQLLGRAISRTELLARYGTKGRTAGQKSADFELIEDIVNSAVFLDAQVELEAIILAAEKMRATLKHQGTDYGREAKNLLSASAALSSHLKR